MCGCKASADRRRTDAGMCAACKWSTPERCTLDGERFRRTVRPIGKPCPLGRHSDAEGKVRWLGLRWYGVPAPLRWFKLRGRRWPGCGCIVALKDAWALGGWLIWLAVWFGIGAWIAVWFAQLIVGPRSLPPIPGAVPTQPEATAWASPVDHRPRGYWYHFRKLTGARAATLPMWSAEPIRDDPAW